MADWANLPIDILALIIRRLDFLDEFISFCVVCKSWRSVTSVLGKSRTLPLPPRFPWVMLTDIAEKNYPKLKVTRDININKMLAEKAKRNEYIEGMYKRRFFSFSTSRTHEIELPEATRRKCIGVRYGWLLTLGYDLQINLLHPFTRQQIGMPPLLSFKTDIEYREDYKPEEVISFFLWKAVTSTNPHNSSIQDCIILVIYGGRRELAFARPGDEVWTNVSIPLPRVAYMDVLYYKGKFYAVNGNGTVFACDIDDENGPKATTITSITRGLHDLDQKYLVESSGSLLLVRRHRRGRYFENEEDVDRDKPTNYYTSDFSVFRLEECLDDRGLPNYPYRLTKLDSLGDNALFIGFNASVSLPSSKCIKANCIYFSDDTVEYSAAELYGAGHDIGIFDLESRTITSHYAAEFFSRLTPPIWFI